ncbi:hypothetical protein [Sinomonas terrae]|uniref:Secreted protein n=1 Tax=Sinomonas terrae TaxID=2908838 RepID=A0ABS9U4F1_9MICC|nr:hypothetical protein [Sinomonas terrae]MCH6471530.1 hypothetical protein [Sinomonas terrae]
MRSSLRRVLILLAATLFTLWGGMTAASATTNFAYAPSGSHYASGYSEPVCSFNNATATASCTNTQIQGVGHTNATVTLTVYSSFTGVCHNPGNHNVVTPFTRTDTTSTHSDLVSSRNGGLVVPPQSTTGESTSDFLKNFSCPNPNWTPEVTQAQYSYRYTLVFDGFTQPAILITGP